MKNKSDQLVAPVQPVAFATKEAAERILGSLYSEFQQAAGATDKQETIAQQRGEEIARRQTDINKYKAEIDRLEVENSSANYERNEAAKTAQAHRDVAKGAADTLALLGHPIPPEQLDVLRAGNWARVQQLHNVEDAQNPPVPL